MVVVFDEKKAEIVPTLSDGIGSRLQFSKHLNNFDYFLYINCYSKRFQSPNE